MGACSSKPKTTEFEGVVEHRKPADVAGGGQPQETKRSLDNIADDHGKEAPAKVGEGAETSHATTEAVQITPEPDVGEDKGLSKRVLPRLAEGSPEAESDFFGEKEAVRKETNDEVEQKESKAVGVTDDAVLKDDVAVPDQTNQKIIGTADIKESRVADEAKTNADIKESSVGDDSKTCDDKAVVSEEAGSSQGDTDYVDKTVPIDEEKAAENRDKRNIIVPEEDATMLDSAESAGVDSPITGVVQPVELTTNEEDVSNKVFALADDVRAQEDTQLADNFPDMGAGTIATEEFQKDALARESPTEGIEASGVEILAPTSAVETLPPISALETLAPVEADPLKDVEKGTSNLQGEAASDAVVDVSSATADLKVGAPLDESVVNQNVDSHAITFGNGGSADNLEVETPKLSELAVSKIPTSDLKTEDAQEGSKTEGLQEESVEKKAMEETDVSNGPSQSSATEEVKEGVGPTVTLDEKHKSKSEREEVEKENPDKPHLEHKISGDGPFEDASDAPLKLETGKSIESGLVL